MRSGDRRTVQPAGAASDVGLIERAEELAQLRAAIADAKRHKGRLISIEAAAGLGKTSLLDAAATLGAAAGLRCVRARASELERDFAYGCVRQLFELLLSRVSPAVRGELFAGVAAQARGLFEPGGPDAADDSAYSLLHGLYWLVHNISATEPLVMLVDDVHWADVESLELLAYLAPRLDGLAVVVVTAQRPDEGHREEGRARLSVAPETTVVRPRLLSVDATAALCRTRLCQEPAPEFVSACHEATGGNPFYLDALLREVSEQEMVPDERGAVSVRRIGPVEIARAVRLRLEAHPEALALVRAIAVLGDRSTQAECARLARLDGPAAAAAADLLVRQRILVDGDELEFRHPILREASYADLGPRERAHDHARAAEILGDLGASEERVAAQIVKADPAGDPTRVARLRHAAASALSRGGPSAAVALLTRALAEPPPPELTGTVLLELVLAKLRLGRPQAAIEELELVVRLLDQPDQTTKAARMLAEALTWHGDPDRAVTTLGRAIESLAADLSEHHLLLEAERAACAQLGSRDVRDSIAAGLPRFGHLRGETRGERLILASVAYEQARQSDTAAVAETLLADALRGRVLVEESDLDVAGTIYLILIALLRTDHVDLVDTTLERMLELAQERGSVPAQAFTHVTQGWAALRRGAVARAEAHALTTLELLTTYRVSLGTSNATGLLVEALIESGDLDRAQSALEECPPAEETRPGPTNPLLRARGLLRLAQGRAEEAVEDLMAFGRDDELWGAAHPVASGWRSPAAMAVAATGDVAAARDLAAEGLARARHWGAPSGIGTALRTVALLAEDGVSIDLLGEAVEVLDGSPARLEHTRALVDLGAALRRANRRADARQTLQPCVAMAERLGALTLAARARTELTAAGGSASPPGGSAGVAAEQLTASERRVAELAAHGHSNPEIAQLLFVTRKTVETHLGRVYRKLGIAGRRELPGRLGAPERP